MSQYAQKISRSHTNSRVWQSFIWAVVALMLFSACETFEYSPYQADTGGRENINAENIARFIDNESDTTVIAIIGDTQRFYGSTEQIIEDINSLDYVDFVAHTGDIVDFGLQREYDWMIDLLDQLEVPYVAVAGNHDLIGNGDIIYQHRFGPLNFSFVFNETKYVFINTNSREFGFEPNVPDVNWLSAELSDSSDFTQAIIVQHVPPTHEDFNADLLDDFFGTITENNNVLLSINGHKHNFSYSEPIDGVHYLNSFSGETEQYILLKVWDGGYSFELK